MSSLRTKLVTAVAVAATAVSGAAVAGAATNGSSSGSAGQSGHTVNGKSEQALTGTTASKVRAAALAKVPGSIDRLETNVDGSAPYEAHIVRKSDGAEVEVQGVQGLHRHGRQRHGPPRRQRQRRSEPPVGTGAAGASGSSDPGAPVVPMPDR